MNDLSVRAQVITRRTYNRPLNDEGTVFETWEQTVDRVIDHQRWLWERAAGRPLSLREEAELDMLAALLLDNKITVSGRTLWLGGTEVAKRCEASQFNCSFAEASTVHDVVDAFWLLLQGCGYGFHARPGILNGFAQPVAEIEIVRSRITMANWEAGVRGQQTNSEEFREELTADGDVFGTTKVWHLTIGDSAEAWAKAAGKLMAMKKPVDRIILDFSNIRPEGIRLKGYGWISSGDSTVSKAFKAICELMSSKAGQLLNRIDILDVMNWLGTTLSSRRSAEAAICAYNDPEWETFALAKKDHYTNGQPQRSQSNNTLVFYQKPSKAELFGVFHIMMMAGGSEPGFANGEAALKRAPWFKGFNPCFEILLGDKSFCNLVEVNLPAFNGDVDGLHRAVILAARANYRQTCVDLRDGVLQTTWHELNEYLRLCGVGLTGIMMWEFNDVPVAYQLLKDHAWKGAISMADQLGLPRPKGVTTVKPSGTQAKRMDVTEGVHMPLGKYIFNNVRFSNHDPLVPVLRDAGYRVFPDPYDDSGVLITLPVSYENLKFTEATTSDGRVVQVNQESAIDQLERYKMLMDHYVDYNCSITVYYSPEEVPAMVDWLYENWDSYVAVSFLYRNDPTKTAADLGYPYLPQEVVSEDEYLEYVSGLKPVSLDGTDSHDEVKTDECAGGVCPVR